MGFLKYFDSPADAIRYLIAGIIIVGAISFTAGYFNALDNLMEKRLALDNSTFSERQRIMCATPGYEITCKLMERK